MKRAAPQYSQIIKHFPKDRLFVWEDNDPTTKTREINPALFGKIMAWKDCTQKIYLVPSSEVLSMGNKSRDEDILLGYITPREKMGSFEDDFIRDITSSLFENVKRLKISSDRRENLISSLDNAIGNSWKYTQRFINKATEKRRKVGDEKNMHEAEFLGSFNSAMECFFSLHYNGILTLSIEKIARKIAPRFFSAMQSR